MRQTVWICETSHSSLVLFLLQTFLRVRANRHTRLNGTWLLWLLCFIAADSVCGWERERHNLPQQVSQVCRSQCFMLEDYYHTVTASYVSPSSPAPPTQPYRNHLSSLPPPPFLNSFSYRISTGLAPTRAEELLTPPFQLWPLDMLTVDDLCWCRCYVKSAPLRPHSAGAHLDCTQAGKMHREALLFLHSHSLTNFNELRLRFASFLLNI